MGRDGGGRDEGKKCVAVPKKTLEDLAALEQKYVHEVYDKIALHFSHTRYKPWPRVKKFLCDLPAGSIVLDTGCGNGKYLSCAPHVTIIGVDRNLNFLSLCRKDDSNRTVAATQVLYEATIHSDVGRLTPESEVSNTAVRSKNVCTSDSRQLVGRPRGAPTVANLAFSRAQPDVYTGDCRKVGIRTGAVDAALSIAVVHHLTSEHDRILALRELARCTRSGGQILIYVWAFEQQEGSIGFRAFESQDVFVPWHLDNTLVTSGVQQHSSNGRLCLPSPLSNSTTPNEIEKIADATECSSQAVSEPQQERKTLQRYYHVFTETEVQNLCKQVNDVAEVLSIQFDSNNWVIQLRRLG